MGWISATNRRNLTETENAQIALKWILELKGVEGVGWDCGWWVTSTFRKYMVWPVGSGLVMI